MGTPASPIEPRQVGILILDDDAQSQGALKQILDSEGWRVRMVPDTKAFLAELRTGEWSLVIANVTITGTASTYRVFWDGSAPKRFVLATDFVVGQ